MKKILVSIAILAFAGVVFADTTLTDLTTSRLPTGGVFKVTTDETLTTLTVNKMTVNTGTFVTVVATTGVTLPAGSVEATDIAGGAMANAMLISNAANKVYCYTNVATDSTVSGRLLNTGDCLISNAASKVYCATNIVTTAMRIMQTPYMTKVAASGAVVLGDLSNAPAGTITNAIWFGFYDAASTNYYVIPAFQSTVVP